MPELIFHAFVRRRPYLSSGGQQYPGCLVNPVVRSARSVSRESLFQQKRRRFQPLPGNVESNLESPLHSSISFFFAHSARRPVSES